MAPTSAYSATIGIQDAPTNAIAVIGMGCKFPGAESVEEYWQLLDAGLSMVTEAATGRFPTRDHKRSTDKSVFLGNFLRDIENFDNRFFKKSSREAASMDPQQRLLLEVAYQALESSGYFGPREKDTEVGCFVGVCASDYNDNVASHPPNAFSTLGTLRAFLTGKISHFFGFSGPSVTFDTACSSSAVAIDAACKAIIHGDCTSAIAGGVSVFTSPHFYQNLAAASFLSQTGATKSFDAGADGYCRGEGIGLVVLKSLSKALADGDTILGTILSTSVKQSSNVVPITVPYSPSQAALYHRVLKMAGVSPDDVSYLEAHGTGTPIGDPQEFQGIKEVFQSPTRPGPLYFASVKGNIGHTEGASGVAGLIKVLLMMQKRAIVRQASYSRLNPKIQLDPSQFRIPTETVPWKSDVLIACVNNYGAAGSIAAMVVKEPTKHNHGTTSKTSPPALSKYPLLVSANSAKSLGENCAKLRQYLSSFNASSSANVLADMAYNLSDHQDRSLPNMFITAVSSMSELDDQLRIAASTPESQLCRLNPSPKPVVLSFGGQTSRFIGLSRSVYNSSALLRKYLDECDQALKGLGHGGIYPAIFDSTPMDDVVQLQTMQFALHYACAQSWIACGLKVDCVVGHSFGQLVALTVAGVFSLEDGIKLVHGRAVLMRDKWGAERGTMIALDADHGNTMGLISSVRKTMRSSGLEVACYNGPRSHVLVGSSAEVDAVIEVIKKSTAVKYKVLNVTHGFHSRFCDAIIPGLEALAASLTYNPPKIRIETTSDRETWAAPTPKLIADHTRTPVYFEDAIKRIEARYGSCTWVEAGSNSSVTSIARRSLSDAESRDHLFCPVNLSREDALGALADTATNLWKNGNHVQFWPFHRIHRADYQPLNLPPYQFEKVRHWLDFNYVVEQPKPVQVQEKITEATPVAEPEPVLIVFSGFDVSDTDKRRAVFTIDPRSQEWRALVTGHAVLQQPLCPAPLYVELVLQAAKITAEAEGISALTFGQLEGLEITSSLGTSDDKIIKLFLTPSDGERFKWDFSFQSQPRGVSNTSTKTATHAVGSVKVVTTQDDTTSSELDRISRLIRHRDFDEVTTQADGEAVQGSLVYKVFSRVVQYHDFYKGVRQVAGHKGAVVAQVVLPSEQPDASKGLLSNPVAVDNFLQVPGLYANCLGPCPADEVFVCTQVDRLYLSREFEGTANRTWKVCATSTATSERESVNDVLVFEQQSGKLVFVAFGAHFSRVRITSLAKVLSRANEGQAAASVNVNVNGITKSITRNTSPPRAPPPFRDQNSVDYRDIPTQQSVVATPAPPKRPAGPGLEQELRELLTKVTDVPADQFKGEVTLADLGIDSLVTTEIVSEIDQVLGVSIPQDHLQDLQTFGSLCAYLATRLGRELQDAPAISQTALPSQQSYANPSSLPVQQTPSAPERGRSRDSENLLPKLASLLASHLECSPTDFERSTNLADRGLDSLLCIELMSDIDKTFGVSVDLAQLTSESTFGDLADMFIKVTGRDVSPSDTTNSTITTTPTPPTPTSFEPSILPQDPSVKIAPRTITDRRFQAAPDAFESIKDHFGDLADTYHLTDFYKNVYPKNARLVLAYTVEAFSDLGIDLNSLRPGDEIPALASLPKHHHLRDVLYEVLRDGKIADYNGKTYVRSDEPIDKAHSSQLFNDLVQEFPQHAKEHMLLNLCGSELGKLISGAKEPLTVLFGSKKNRDILEDVYSTSPMYVIMSQLLTRFLEKALSSASPGSDGVFRIIELGAGTGSTTKWVVDRLVRCGIPVEYTFTDISPSLVSEGKRKFAKYSCMRYATINIEKEPPSQYHGQYDIVLSTNCIHATSNLRRSLTNIDKLLRPHGFVSLVEFTSRMFWFDLVFGLLEGWWLFDDGRPYVLASPEFWEKSMRESGFQHVSWTGGTTRESEIVRVITGFKQPVDNPSRYLSTPQETTGEVETVVFKHTDKSLPLRADIYHPTPQQAAAQKNWTVGLMIHGGGHVMLSRKDVRPRQIQHLLHHGVLPISVDYRLCPETTLLSGPLPDVSDAYAWARTVLPTLKLSPRSPSLVIDPSRAVAIGWSTGGTLAMSLAWTSPPRGLPPPDAILAFYCPTNYQDPFWQSPNIPDHSAPYSHSSDFNLLDCVQPAPITGYNIPPHLLAAGGWMTPRDSRSRLVLHMNWRGQTLPVLFRGLPHASSVPDYDQQTEEYYTNMPQPDVEEIIKASPYAQIVRGEYKTPTHIVFGTKDDLIPWQQAEKTVAALRERGVEVGFTLGEGEPHLFDLYRDPEGRRWGYVEEGYKFLLGRVGRL
ncbi:hypothetical protein QBC41DRAFT_385815 [Cercophora samala]|uniref:S-adenosyl-L-methionine-dependent N-methyltransferase n=1 Tax=Cercophora samala TaxID=330535 RepID=A0AA39YTI1_9PEZI|nr:hypothetical protein QBC41DRAFT_385815 [Cercophora samala]